MTWTLQVPNSDGSASLNTRNLPKAGVAYIVLLRGGTTLAVVHEMRPALQTELGRITTGPFGAKLEAIDYPLKIQPGHTTNDPQPTDYELSSRVDGRSEVMILRHGDIIKSGQAMGNLTCTWTASVIQVNSSAAVVEPKVADTFDGVAETSPEEDTEDEDLDNTIAAEQHQGTPQLSNQRSVIIQETPTTARMQGVMESLTMPVGIDLRPAEASRSPEADHVAELEPYSTAHTGQSQNGIHEQTSAAMVTDQEGVYGGNISNLVEFSDSVIGGPSEDTPQKSRHPKVLISRKRPSPGVEQEPEALVNRKRAKRNAPSDDDTQDSRLSNIIVNTSPVAALAKGRKRKSTNAEVEEAKEATPSRSQRSSQRSVTATTAEVYDGDMPRVATSSSSLTDKSQAVKFLKKQGGSFITSVREEFNLLCVRDGELHKTPKILLAIANGTPIVTDKWLADSAKAGHFLSVKAYMPSVPKQEKEWNINLISVAGQPQKVFEGYTVHFTTSLYSAYKTFAEIEQVCKAAGAAKVTKKKMHKSDKVIVLAAEEDAEAEKLMQDGIVCYNRELLPISILRGSLDLDSDEFRLIAAAASNAQETKPKRGRKS